MKREAAEKRRFTIGLRPQVEHFDFTHFFAKFWNAVFVESEAWPMALSLGQREIL